MADLTNIEHLRVITDIYQRKKGVPQLMKTQPKFVSVPDDEPIQYGDLVEDLGTGTREQVETGRFYNFLIGMKASQAKNMPTIYDILRRTH
jgi:hypothetical protein